MIHFHRCTLAASIIVLLVVTTTVTASQHRKEGKDRLPRRLRPLNIQGQFMCNFGHTGAMASKSVNPSAAVVELRTDDDTCDGSQLIATTKLARHGRYHFHVEFNVTRRQDIRPFFRLVNQRPRNHEEKWHDIYLEDYADVDYILNIVLKTPVEMPRIRYGECWPSEYETVPYILPPEVNVPGEWEKLLTVTGNVGHNKGEVVELVGCVPDTWNCYFFSGGVSASDGTFAMHGFTDWKKVKPAIYRENGCTKGRARYTLEFAHVIGNDRFVISIPDFAKLPKLCKDE